ncbi:hypothetical protein WR25_12166 isoform D [Diploscapter pachys]|uniref:Uncharacterized protein n=1 Tax=Diploscapter pachys TaxID=2018661 RepID=A0A2A2KVR6_9BILA|nr:hypothetical protein WR25_12166 isoform D [Diploscapter pachys]
MPFALYKCVLITSVFLIVLGIFLTLFSIFSPYWEIVEIPRLHMSHQHGLWWDCKVHHNVLIPLDQIERERIGDTCVSKFDNAVQDMLRGAIEKGDAESKELLSHKFLPHHKGVLFFSVFTILFALIGAIIGICSPCFPPNSLLYVVSIFMTSSCSVLADIIFVFGASEKDRRSPPQPTLSIPSSISSRSNDLGVLNVSQNYVVRSLY